MKKIFTLISFLTLTIATLAQTDESLQFVNKAGNVVVNGDTYVVTDGEVIGDDEWAYIQLPTGLYVKNTTSANAYAFVTYQVKAIDNGAFQICFPINCNQKTETGVARRKQRPAVGMDCRRVGTLRHL